MNATCLRLLVLGGVLAGGCGTPRDAGPAPAFSPEAAPDSARIALGNASARPVARPTFEIVSDLIATDDRRRLEVLVRELSNRTLPDEDVARLIEASRRDPSEAHRQFVWSALLHSDSQAARDHLAEVLLLPPNAGAAAEMLSHVDRVPSGAVPLLVRAYRESSSDLLRDAVLGVASGGERHAYSFDEGNGRLLEAILDQPASEQHRAEALLVSLQRPGAGSARTFERVREAVTTTADPETRVRLIRILAAVSPAECLVFVLTTPMAESDARIAIEEFSKRASSDPRLLTERPAVIQAVRRTAESSPPSPLRAEARDLRELTFEAAVNEANSDAERQAASVLRGMTRLAEQPRDRATMLLAMWATDTSPAFVEGRLDALESRFGPLPDRAAARARLDATLASARDALRRASP